jgi:peptidyl-prolyl cis-trans isomerase A (cyclophilin A)
MNRRQLLSWALSALALFGASGAQAQVHPQVTFRTNLGNIVVELYPEHAPKTVANFVRYVQEGHYNGTIFHRVIPNFMVQGGGFDAQFREKSTHAPVKHEGRQALAGGLRNATGTLAMARTADPQSATAQFYINVNNNNFLDPVEIPPGDPVPYFQYRGRTFRNAPRAALLESPQLIGYTVFGRVIQGMNVVQQIVQVPTGAGGPFPTDVPRQTVTILQATLSKGQP